MALTGNIKFKDKLITSSNEHHIRRGGFFFFPPPPPPPPPPTHSKGDNVYEVKHGGLVQPGMSLHDLFPFFFFFFFFSRKVPGD